MKPDFSTMPPATTNSAAPQTPSPIPTQLPEYKPDTQLLRERNRQLLKDIFKATVAFTVASMLTLIAPLHQHIGNASHMAAVATLFFHPCKSVGAMLETTVLGAIGAVFATAIAAVGASTAAYLNAHGRLVESAVFLLFLIFGSTFLLAYIRANSSRIPVYTGTVIAHIIIAIALTAYASQGQLEVDWERLWGLLVPIGCGLLISLLTNILVFPKSATNLLRNDISKSMKSFRSLLELFTNSFLLSRSHANQYRTRRNRLSQFEAEMARHQSCAMDLARTSSEAKHEVISWLVRTRGELFHSLIRSVNRLTQHVGGMKSSLIKQDELLRGLCELSPKKTADLIDFIEHIGPSLRTLALKCSLIIGDLDALIMRDTNSWWCALVPDLIFYDGGRVRNARLSIMEIEGMQGELDEAISLFNECQKRELQILYDKEKFDGRPNDEVFLVYYYVFCLLEFAKELRDGVLASSLRIKQTESQGGWLRRLVRWLTTPIEAINDTETGLLSPINEQTPLLHAQPSAVPQTNRNSTISRYFHYLQSQTNGAYHNYLKSPAIGKQQNATQSSTSNASPHSQQLLSPPQQPVSPPVPEAASTMLRYRLLLWRLLSDIGNSFGLKFALKTALLVTLVSMLAFIPETRALYADFKGQWTILSIVVIMTPTVGGSNMAGLYRALGTVAGAAYSYMAWTLFPGDPIGLAVLLALFSLCAFYVMLATEFPKVAQVSLVTVCAVVLAQYSNLDNPDWSMTILDLAIKRGAAVLSGLLLGLFVTWYVWPYEARVELRVGLSDLLLNMGILYSRLVEIFNQPTVPSSQSPAVPSSHRHHRRRPSKMKEKITLTTLHRHLYLDFSELSDEDTLEFFMAFELKLQLALMRLKQLLPLTWLEPRLKGPFPVQVYDDLIRRSQNILDKFVAMRVAIANNVAEWNSAVGSAEHRVAHTTGFPSSPPIFNASVRQPQGDLILGLAPPSVHYSHPFIRQQYGQSDNNGGGLREQQRQQLPTHPHLLPLRREMVGSVLLCFYTFAGALILKQPLPTYLPPARQCRKRLLEGIRQIMSSASLPSTESTTADPIPDHIKHPERYINYYAYSLAMEDVIRELELIGWLLKGLFGEMFSDVVQFEEPEPSRFPDDDAVQILCGEDNVLSDDCFNDDEAEETGTFYSPVDCSPAFIDQQSDPFGYEEQLKVNFAAQDEASLPASRMSSPALATLSHSNEEWRSLVTPNSVSSSPARGTTTLCPTPPRRSNSFHERWRQSGLWMK